MPHSGLSFVDTYPSNRGNEEILENLHVDTINNKSNSLSDYIPTC